jgi:hypothetical protein
LRAAVLGRPSIGTAMAFTTAIVASCIDVGGFIELLSLIIFGAPFYLVSNVLPDIEALKEMTDFIKGSNKV